MAKNGKNNNIFQGIARYWRETVGELRKVTWPTPPEAWALTKIVLIVTVIMAAILGLLDFAFSQLIGFLVG
jgi:preprotein translocase subunit SecE